MSDVHRLSAERWYGSLGVAPQFSNKAYLIDRRSCLRARVPHLFPLFGFKSAVDRIVNFSYGVNNLTDDGTGKRQRCQTEPGTYFTRPVISQDYPWNAGHPRYQPSYVCSPWPKDVNKIVLARLRIENRT